MSQRVDKSRRRHARSPGWSSSFGGHHGGRVDGMGKGGGSPSGQPPLSSNRTNTPPALIRWLSCAPMRCIEQLYDDYGLGMLDALSESKNPSAALVVTLSRLNEKIEDSSDARLSLNKICSDTIANNYYRSLGHHSPSFKQLDTKRMSPHGSFSIMYC
ncbi:hypothetical protein ABZP36_020556 [Zizania latifolia]